MFSKTMCFNASLISIILSVMCMTYWYFNFDNLDFISIGLRSFLSVLIFIVFPISLYYLYLHSDLNKWIAFILAFLTSVICFCLHIFTYHFRTNFKYWGTGLGTENMTGLFIFFHSLIAIVCAIIYFVAWWKQRK